MTYTVIMAISAPLEIVETDDKDTTVKAQYVTVALNDDFETALDDGVKLAQQKFNAEGGRNQVTISTNTEMYNGKPVLKSAYLGHTDYAPLSLVEVPLIIVQASDLSDLEGTNKFFKVPTASIAQ